jgi:Cys-rich protein (TIGR01571 family)
MDDDYSQLTTATRRDDYDDDYDGPCIIRVVAPATLEEGYTFDVLVEDEPYTVQVPAGGIREGEEFEVEYNPEEQQQNYHRSGRNTNNNNMEQLAEEDEEYHNYEDDKHEDLNSVPTRTISGDESNVDGGEEGGKDDESKEAIWYDENGAPIGGWRTKLWGCCDVLTQSTFWMGMCCTPILMAQLISRLKLTWNGRVGAPEETSLSYNRILISLIFTLGLFWVPILGWILVLVFYAVVVVFIGSHVRSYMRQKYKIPATLPYRCGQRIDDVFFMLFCGCCSSIQMARHTHDDKEYPGHGCTTTGLGPDAPEIV